MIGLVVSTALPGAGFFCLHDPGQMKRKRCRLLFPVKKLLPRQHIEPLFSSPKKSKFLRFASHRILRHMHEILNIEKKQKLITQFACKSRDESFDPS